MLCWRWRCPPTRVPSYPVPGFGSALRYSRRLLVRFFPSMPPSRPPPKRPSPSPIPAPSSAAPTLPSRSPSPPPSNPPTRKRSMPSSPTSTTRLPNLPSLPHAPILHRALLRPRRPQAGRELSPIARLNGERSGLGAVIDATGTVRQVEQAFKVRLSDYRDTKGRVFFANNVTPAIPVAVANLIDGIIGWTMPPWRCQHRRRAARPPRRARASRAAPTRQGVCSGAQAEAKIRGTCPNSSRRRTPQRLYTRISGRESDGRLPRSGGLPRQGPADVPEMLRDERAADARPRGWRADGSEPVRSEAEVDLDIEAVVGLAPNLANILELQSRQNNLALPHSTGRSPTTTSHPSSASVGKL